MTADLNDGAAAVLGALADATMNLDHAATEAREYGHQGELLAALGTMGDIERNLEAVTALVAGAKALLILARNGGAR